MHRFASVMRRGFLLLLLWLALEALAPAARAAPAVSFRFYWAVGCPHCAEARPFVKSLGKKYPRLQIESWEVKRDPAGRKRFIADVKRLKIQNPSVPTFICGDGYVAGYQEGKTEPCVHDLVRRCTR